MIHYRIEAKTDLQEKRIKPKELTDVLYLADKQSTAIAVSIYDNGVEFDLTGYSVVCWWMYPSTGETLVFSGEVRGTNQAVCVPPDEMYSVPGRGLLTIKVVQGGDVDCTVFSAWVDVVRSTTDEQTATGQTIANLDALLPLADHTQEILDFATDSGWIHIENTDNIDMNEVSDDPTNPKGVMYRKKGNQVTICARAARNTGIITDNVYPVGMLPEGARPLFNQHVMFCSPFASAAVLSNYSVQTDDPFAPDVLGSLPLLLLVDASGRISVRVGVYPMDHETKIYPNGSADYTYAKPDFQMGSGIFFNYTFFTN